MAKYKPLTKMEMKMIIFSKMKKGLSYAQARQQLSDEIEGMRKSHSLVIKADRQAEAKATEDADETMPVNLRIKGGKYGRRNERSRSRGNPRRRMGRT